MADFVVVYTSEQQAETPRDAADAARQDVADGRVAAHVWTAPAALDDEPAAIETIEPENPR